MAYVILARSNFVGFYVFTLNINMEYIEWYH